jgi:hypothetical protein
MTIGFSNEIRDSSVDCQSDVAFVIEVVGTLGLSIGPNNYLERNHTRRDEPITQGIVRKLVVGLTPPVTLPMRDRLAHDIRQRFIA